MDHLIDLFKKGYKTTEFWLTAAAGTVVIAEATTGLDLDNEGILGLVGAVAAYVLSRSYLKGKRIDAVAYGANGNPTVGPPPVG